VELSVFFFHIFFEFGYAGAIGFNIGGLYFVEEGLVRGGSIYRSKGFLESQLSCLGVYPTLFLS
jgi:hypothetical protein